MSNASHILANQFINIAEVAVDVFGHLALFFGSGCHLRVDLTQGTDRMIDFSERCTDFGC
ncbi:Uncharacterised protein [Vibrio cholerae]|uniref:Uncharacterized protein n=1 Tax=Vibrio cholerae TaxID=666 RepID=A0A655PR11_VIBCL|nr:Uncharacterised protein [Vibrio cholerae]CSI54995.1 Uncharacterised protein [Vibrio cholerae]